MTPVMFKYREVNAEGQEVGMLATRGEITDKVIKLGKDEVPIAAVMQVIHRQNRLVLILATQDGPVPLTLSITSGKPGQIKQTLDHLLSHQWAEHHREELGQTGKESTFRSATCPVCGSTVDLTGFAKTPQLFCPFCDCLTVLDEPVRSEDRTYKLCDECGLFSQPKPFTTFYLIFAVVFVYHAHKTTTRCNACMRAEAWKMLLGNMITLIGTPIAAYQLMRAYYGGSGLSRRFAGLDQANLAARARKVERAAALYEAILEREPVAAGIRYNLARAYAEVKDWENCLLAAKAALEDCGNYRPAAELVLASLEALGHQEQAEAFKEIWGQIT